MLLLSEASLLCNDDEDEDDSMIKAKQFNQSFISIKLIYNLLEVIFPYLFCTPSWLRSCCDNS